MYVGNRHIRTLQRDSSAEGGLGSAKCTMEKTLQSNGRILHKPTFERNASAENSGDAEVYEMHYGENVVMYFNVMPPTTNDMGAETREMF